MPPVSNIIKLFLCIIYATSGILPCDFDRGYTDSDIIMSKKIYNIAPRFVMKCKRLMSKFLEYLKEKLF